MPSFVLDPVIRVHDPRYRVLHTIEDAVDFVRAAAPEDPNRDWQDVLRRLERVRSEDDALEAAVALEGLLERESLLNEAIETMPVSLPAARPPLLEPRAAPRAMSMLYAAARAEPDR